MTYEIVAASLIALAVLALLISERLPSEVTALLAVAALVLSGVLEPGEAFASLGSPVVVMIGGVMLLTGALVHTGVPQLLVRVVRGLPRRREGGMRAVLTLAVGGVSAFINNVAATAMFIPVAEGLARAFRTDRRAYLMPVAFASLAGGLCTLIGTSTNVAVAGKLPDLGLEPLGFFELTPIGLLVTLVATVYLVAAPRWLGWNRVDTEEEGADLREFLYEVHVLPGSPLVDRTLSESDPAERLGLTVLAIRRGADTIQTPGPFEPVRTDDLLLVKSRSERISQLRDMPGFRVVSMPPPGRTALFDEGPRLTEVTVSWNSPLIGQTVEEIDFRHQFGVSVLAIHRRDTLLAERVAHIPLEAGDVLLVFGRREMAARLGEGGTRLLVADVVPPGLERPAKAALALAIFLAAVATVVVGLLDSATAFLAGGALVLATGIVPRSQVPRYVNVRFLILIAGLLALSAGLERSGAAAALAGLVIGLLGADPYLQMTAMFALTVLLTQPLSNAAAALLVLPLAVAGAVQLGIDPRPFAVTVTVAASCSFLTPFEPACLLVYGSGHYRFRDFARMGAPLTLAVFLIVLLIVPRLWPF